MPTQDFDAHQRQAGRSRCVLSSNPVGHGSAPSVGTTTLSEAAAATLSFLAAMPNSVVCERCLCAHLGVDRYDVLKSIQGLIHAGRILCTYAACAICLEQRLVAQVRAERRQSLGT
jgi:hypothetical protein